MYSKAALHSANKAWNELSTLMDAKPLLFKTAPKFKMFYNELCERLITDKETY